jgi:hypothetical protein
MLNFRGDEPMERAMRWSIWATLAGTMLAFSITPAAAAWNTYFSKAGLEFSFNAPAELKAEKAPYNSRMAGSHNSVVFRAVEDNVEFKITVVDFAGRASDEAALIKEASDGFLASTTVLLDTDARVEASYGRKLTVDLPNNGGRSMSAIFFKDNHLIQLQATALPGGDLQTPDMGRFVDSLAFYQTEGATELKPTN